MTTIETLQTIGDALLVGAQINIQADGSLMPCVVTIKDGTVTNVVALPDTMEKHATYRAFARKLTEWAPDAVILINDAYLKTITKDEIRGYKHGDYAADPEATECLIIVFKGPGIETHLKTLPYTRNEVGDIVFKEVVGWSSPAILSLLPDWW